MPKRKRSSCDRQDYISNLPDFIIGHILSYLSPEDAVRTSVLSKRWIYMWTFLTKLDFGDYRYKDRVKQFSNFVTRVLLNINHASIVSCFFSISQNYDTYYTNQWLSALSNRGVKNVLIVFFSGVSSFSCYALFQSPSLETLRFRVSYRVEPFFLIHLPLPAFSCLPSLKTLDLFGICYCSSNKLKEVTLKLPLLRTYKAINCTWSDVESVTLEAPLLEEVIIMHYYEGWLSPTKLKFCASHLTKFVYRGYVSSLSQTILIDGHIASADIEVTCLRSRINVLEKWVSLCRFLSLFTNTRCLALSLAYFRCLAQVEHHLDGNPAFGMLGHMQLFVTGEVLLSLLLKSPYLKTLVLQYLMDGSDGKMPNFAIVPDCFLSTLKVVKFECFLGRVCELSFAKFVMENALVLERICFLFGDKLTCSEVEKVKEELLLFKKSSSNVIMEFSPPISVEQKKVEVRPNSHVEMLQACPSRPRRQLAKPSWMNDYVCNV